MSIEKIAQRLKENSKPDTTWIVKATKRELDSKKQDLEKIEKELDKVRTSSMQDGWQTQKHSKKSRKWDVLAQQKMKLISEINELEFNINNFKHDN